MTKLTVNFTDHAIRVTLLNSIADDETHCEILGSADVLTRAFNEIVALVERKEMPPNAVPSTEVTHVQPLNAHMKQTTKHVVMQPHAIHLVGQNNRVVRSASDCFSSTRKGFVIGIPNLIPCVLNATGDRDTNDVTLLLK